MRITIKGENGGLSKKMNEMPNEANLETGMPIHGNNRGTKEMP